MLKKFLVKNKSILILILVVVGGFYAYDTYYKPWNAKLELSNNKSILGMSNQEELAKLEKETNISDNAKVYDKQFVVSEGFADLVEHVLPSVVSITAVKVLKPQTINIPEEAIDPMFREFFKQLVPPQQEKKAVLLGAGYIVRSDGFVVTNYHVIKGAQDIKIIMQDGTKIQAEIYAWDEPTDIALIKVASTNLPTLKLGDSDKARVGDWVIAIGNPFGLGGTVSTGIVSARGRDINIGNYTDFIQTDAAINRGNSGGPMINTKGEVIGTNTAIFSTIGGGSIGIGFAIPSNTVKEIVAALILNKKVVRGWLGVQIQGIDDDIAKSLKLHNTNGALVAGVLDNSPAQKAGIQSGDVVIKIDGVVIENGKSLTKIIGKAKPGSTLVFTIVNDGIEKNLTVQIGTIPDDLLNKAEEEDNKATLQSFSIKELIISDIGIKISDINNEIKQLFKLPKNAKGVVITAVKNNSIAYNKGFSAGLKIVSINQKTIENIKQVSTILEKDKNSGLLFLLEDQQNRRIFVNISKEEINDAFNQ